MAAGDNALGNGGNLVCRLAKAEDHFREALALRALVVDAGETQVFDRLGVAFRRQSVRRLRGG